MCDSLVYCSFSFCSLKKKEVSFYNPKQKDFVCDIPVHKCFVEIKEEFKIEL